MVDLVEKFKEWMATIQSIGGKKGAMITPQDAFAAGYLEGVKSAESCDKCDAERNE